MDDNTENYDAPIERNGETKSAISADLIRGHINTIILRTLYERDKYGYEIIEEIESKSHGQYTLKQPTLYSALKRLESQGYITAYWKTDEVSLGGRRKYYTLTDSGREITEKNQAEWEYSRTVIDNLISDRSFDFSQPAPSAIDFKILKKSTSRVPVLKDDDYDEDEEDFVSEERQLPKVEIKPETATFTEQSVYYEQLVAPTRSVEPAPAPAPEPEPEVTEPVTVQEPVKQEEVKGEEPFVPYSSQQEEPEPMDEEQRRIVHENYLKLISEPAPKPQVVHEVEPVPVADEIDTDKLIYNNKPETERDYRNLINNLFVKTVKTKPHHEPVQPVEKKTATSTVKLDDMSTKAENDGLKINSSDYTITGSRRKSYNRGSSMFKSSLIISVIFLLEFTMCLLFRKELGVGLTYPFVILAIGAAQLLIFGVLCYTDLGKNSRKPASNLYISACIVVTIILIFIIFIVSILLHVNFASAGDIMAKIIIPCFVALNIPAFAVCFYLFSK
ncbi:MAG: PadR family transcriptional regulator [Clostridia bacterium]|nr:PadR family transcriptional regulator [Clostridia bacterium]